MQVPFVLFNIMFLFEYPKTYTAMQGFVEYVSTVFSQCSIILRFCTIYRSSSITFALGNACSQNCTEGYTRGYGEGDTSCLYKRISPSATGVHSYHWLTTHGVWGLSVPFGMVILWRGCLQIILTQILAPTSVLDCLKFILHASYRI